MNLAIIKNGVVENVVYIEEHTKESTIAHCESQGYVCVETNEAQPNDVYDGNTFTTPPPPEPPVMPYDWFIDIGPFFDRFGDVKMAILTSADPGIRAILADIQIRKWIDLARADVAQSMAYIGSIIPALTPAKQNVILNVIPSDEENLALRKLYFS
jgi:hypothetical protein